MKRLFLFFIVISIHFIPFSQSDEKDIIGDWSGTIPIGDQRLTIIFHIEKKDRMLIGTMDSPDQGTYGLNLSNIELKANQVKFELGVFKISYVGTFAKKDSLTGDFFQGNYSSKLNLKKSETKISKKPNRPQEPRGQLLYKSREVTFTNELEKLSLSGTLTMPRGKGPFPAVVLVSGSGPQNRDSEIMAHKPFLVISDFLTKNGIAVLRYDDRGVGKSEGNFQTATTADFAFDAQSAYIYLKNQKKIDKQRIGILGHSEGGMIAQMVAAADTQVRMIVLIASPGIKISEMMLEQTRTTLLQNGISKAETEVSVELNKKFYQVLLNEPDNEIAKKKIEAILAEHTNSMTIEEANEIKVQQPLMLRKMLSPWFRYFIKLDPDHYLKQIKCPVLAINGDKDMQVSCDENLYGIARSLEKHGNRRYEFHKMPNLNHLMQNATTGAVSEYMKIEETFSLEVLRIIRNWIKAR